MRAWTQLKQKMPFSWLAVESMTQLKQKMPLSRLADESMDSVEAGNASH